MMKTQKGSFDKKELLSTIGLIVLFYSLFTLFCALMGYSLAIPLIFLFLGVHLCHYNKATIRTFLNMGLLITFLILTIHVISQYTTFSPYYVPVAGFTMLAMLLLNDLQLAFLMAFVSSLMTSLILGGGFEMMIIFFLGSLMGAYTIKEARARSRLVTAGVYVMAINVVTMLLIYPDYNLIFDQVFAKQNIYPLIANGFISALLVSATYYLFERMFGVVTNFTLLELSDFNQPLLRRMILEAPGTYHHSLVVSNLAEAAADAVGAHALLTRVGAYYHDIGKMVKPEYFTENQMMGPNKHDGIEPTMSRLVILNHVKEGIELAKKNKLPQAIIDFIPQHHGTGLMYYFYQKSIEEAGSGEQISEESFRYPGPKPQTREAAILLLADSVEGATRALDEHSPNSIEETVNKIINNKFIDGQLDDCDLTLKEIENISTTFSRILSAMYHGRIKYPEMKGGSAKKQNGRSKDGNNDTEPSKENPS